MAIESFQRAHDVEGSSNRSFGLVFTVVFLLIGLWPLIHRAPLRWWALGIAAAIALVTVAWPNVLTTPNRWWTRLGMLMGRIVSPITLGIMFFLVFTPMGWLFRAMGKDPLKLKRQPAATTHWVTRTPPGPKPESLNNQF